MLQSLERMGYAQGEVIDSTPLVSTRAIDMLMRDLFALDPHTVLLVARVIEAVDFDEAQGEEFGIDVANHYGLPSDALVPPAKSLGRLLGRCATASRGRN